MQLPQSIKRQFMTDAVVIGVIVVAAMAYLWYSSQNLPGWDINGDQERLAGEEKTVESNVIVREGAMLSIDDSTLSINGGYDEQYGLFLSGDSELSLSASRLEGGEFGYFFLAQAADGKSPSISVEDSDIVGHSGISLYNRSTLTARDSDIGKVILRDDVSVDLETTTFFPVLLSDGTASFDNLKSGDHITKTIDSDAGWQLTMDDCTVLGYQIELSEGDRITLTDSSDITLSLHTPGDLKETADIALPTGTSGSINQMGMSFEWTDVTNILGLNLYAQGTDHVMLSDVKLYELEAYGTSDVEVQGGVLHCGICGSSGSAVVHLDGVTVEQEGNTIPTLLMTGDSEVTIANSDISQLRIVMIGSGDLSISNSTVDESKIDNRGVGAVTIE